MANQKLENAFPEVPKAFHDCVENTLENLGDAPKVKKTKKNYKWVAAASVLLTSTVFASSIAFFKWDDFIANRYQVDELQQEELIMMGNTEQIDLSASMNGVTVKPYQVLKDINSVEIYMEVTMPEDIVLDKPPLFNEIKVDIKGVESVSRSATMKRREGSESEQAVFILSLFDIGPIDKKEIIVDISLKNLSVHNKFEKDILIEGQWEFSIPIHLPENNLKEYEMNKVLQIKDYPITLKKILLTPFTYTLEYDLEQVNELEAYFDTLPTNEYGGRPSMNGDLQISSIQLKDGTIISDLTGGGSIGPEYEKSSYCIALDFGRVIDVEEIKSVRIGKKGIDVPLSLGAE